MSVLIDGVTETVNMKQKKQEDGFLRAFLTPLPASILQPAISSVVKYISGRGVISSSLKQYRDYCLLQLGS